MAPPSSYDTSSSSESSDTSSDSTKGHKRDKDSLKFRNDSSVPVMAATTSLKLLIDPKSNATLFAEAGKDFVDFLFLILALPVGTVAKLITKQRTEGCLGNLYHSIEILGDTYVHSKANINTLLNFTPNASPMSRALPSQGGYVKEAVTYMITDDLVVTPMSITSTITLLNKFNVKDVGALQEKVIDVGKDKGQELLRASLQSRTVLTDVFLGKKISE